MIGPGEKGEVEVAYAASGSTRDDQRAVRVAFAEAEVPEFVLTVKAQIRDRLSVFPSDLALTVSRSGEARSGFEVRNYDDTDWADIIAHPSDEWLRAQTAAIPILAGERKAGSPRQVWRLALIVETSGLTPGDYAAGIVIEPKGATQEPRTVPVHVRVRAPVAAIPGQFFFARVRPGQPVSKEIVIRFEEDAKPSRLEQVVFQHDLGQQLRLEWVATQGTLWRLKATLTAREEAPAVRGLVFLKFTGLDLPALTIPVEALIGSQEEG